MKASDKAIELIKKYEGLSLKAYKDYGGIWTIGYGHTRTAKYGMTITKEQAEELLRKDVETFEKELNAVVKVPLTQNQFDALISFVYNIGISKFKNSKVLKLINDKRFDEAAEELLKWNKAINQFKQYVVVPGLVRRRKDEYLLFKGEVS